MGKMDVSLGGEGEKSVPLPLRLPPVARALGRCVHVSDTGWTRTRRRDSRGRALPISMRSWSILPYFASECSLRSFCLSDFRPSFSDDNAISGEFHTAERFPVSLTTANNKMSGSNSSFGSEPNAFDGESSDCGRGSDRAEASVESVESPIGDFARQSPSAAAEELPPTSDAVPITSIPSGAGGISTSQYCEFLMRDTRNTERYFGCQSEASTSARSVPSADIATSPVVTVAQVGTPRIPLGLPRRALFGVDYLEPNRVTEEELAHFRREFRVPEYVRWRIPGPNESLSDPAEGETVFFTDILKLGVRLPLQSSVQRILGHLGYAVGQYNPNFWVALMSVAAAFNLAGEGEPSYEQFCHLYSVTKAKSADHGGWVQANCIQASVRGHFISHVPTSQKSWRKRRVLVSGSWEAPLGDAVGFSIPTTFQTVGRNRLPLGNL